MSGYWFDAFARLMAHRASRRKLTRAAVVAALAATARITLHKSARAQSTECVECRAISCRDATGSDDCHDQPCYAPMNEESSIYVPVTLLSPVTICPCEMCSERDSTTCYYWSGSHYRHDACMTYPGAIGRAASQQSSESATESPPPSDGNPTSDELDSGVVIVVLDGDSVRAEIEGANQRLNITLLGIDAPEIAGGDRKENECFGDEATAELRRIVEGKTVFFEGKTSRDTSSRAWRYLWVESADGMMLANEALVAGGFARAKSSSLDKRYDARLGAAQREAQEANRGLWGECLSQPGTGGTPEGQSETAGAAMGAGDAARRGFVPGPDPAASPTLLWQFAAQMIRGGDPPPIAMPIALGSTVILSTQTEDAPGLVALSLNDGSTLWTEPLGRVSETPAMSESSVYANTSDYAAANTDPYLYALSIEDGSEQWRFDTGGRILQGPSLFDGVVFISSLPRLSDPSGASRIAALDAKTGATLWVFEDPDQGSLSGTAVAEDIVVAAIDFPAAKQSILGLDRNTGDIRWQTALENWEYEWPVISNGRVIVRRNVGFDQELVALDASTGDEIWQVVLPGQPFSTPAAANGLILVACRGGELLALDQKTGAPVWQISNPQIGSAPTVTGTRAYLSTWSGVLAIDIASGEIVWEMQQGLPNAEQRPFVIDGKILVMLADGSLAAYG